MITREDLGKYSLNVLNLLEKEKIDSIEGLQRRLGESFEVEGGVFQTEARPSGLRLNADSIALTMSYIIDGKGVPIEIRLNVRENYVFMLVKANSTLEDYIPFVYDPLGNIVQSKRFKLSFEGIKEELKRISNKNL